MINIGQIFDQLAAFTARFTPAQENVERGGVRGLLIRDGYSYHAFDDRGPRRKHTVSDVPSLLAYIKRHGTADKTTIFCGNQKFVAVLNDSGEPDLNHITSPLQLTTGARKWLDANGKKRSHVEFKEFIEDRRGDVKDVEPFLAPLLKFKFKSELGYSADLEDGKSVTFTVTEGQEKGTAKVPKQIELEMPLFIGWDRTYVFSVGVEFDLETFPDGRKLVRFCVRFRDFDEVYAQAIEDLLEHAREQLGDDWLVVRGEPAADPQPVLPTRLNPKV